MVSLSQTASPDVDGDGIPNVQDARDMVDDTSDYDNDLVPDSQDRDPLDPSET